ncbi:MAG: RNA-binding protein [Candidatus Omnitrophota bacterium]
MEETKKIYIGNLDYGVKDSDLTSFIESKGVKPTSVAVIMDKYSGRSKGFGFAEFETEEDAQKAIDALNDQDMQGRSLKVNRAQKMTPRKDFGGGSGGRSGGGFGGGDRGRDRDRGNRGRSY